MFFISPDPGYEELMRELETLEQQAKEITTHYARMEAENLEQNQSLLTELHKINESIKYAEHQGVFDSEEARNLAIKELREIHDKCLSELVKLSEAEKLFKAQKQQALSEIENKRNNIRMEKSRLTALRKTLDQIAGGSDADALQSERQSKDDFNENKISSTTKLHLSKIIVKGLYGNPDFSISLKQGANILIGPNGIGKTSIFNLTKDFYNLFSSIVEFSGRSVPTVDDSTEALISSGMNFAAFEKLVFIYSNLWDFPVLKVSLEGLAKPQESVLSVGKNELMIETEISEKEDEWHLHSLCSIKDFNSAGKLRVFVDKLSKSRLANLPLKYPDAVDIIGSSRHGDNRLYDFANCFFKTLEQENLLSGYGNVLAGMLEPLKPGGSIAIDYEKRRKTVINSFKKASKSRSKENVSVYFTPESKMLALSLFPELGKALFEPLNQTTSKNLKTFINKSLKLKHMFSTKLSLSFNKSLKYDVDNHSFVIEVSKTNAEQYPISSLSSGELNYLILIYSLIFTNLFNSVLLVDEPEISLHIEWQRGIFGEILELNKRAKKQIIVATHSPYIADGYEEYITEPIYE